MYTFRIYHPNSFTCRYGRAGGVGTPFCCADTDFSSDCCCIDVSNNLPFFTDERVPANCCRASIRCDPAVHPDGYSGSTKGNGHANYNTPPGVENINSEKEQYTKDDKHSRRYCGKKTRAVHFYKEQNCTKNDKEPSKGNPFKEYHE